MAKKWHFQHGGFSMIELLFAMVLLTVIVMGVVKLQTSNLALSNTQNNEIQAHFLASQGAEVVAALGKDAISSQCSSPPPCDCKITQTNGNYGISCVNGPEDLGAFQRTIEISTNGLTDAYKVTSIVEWVDSTGDHAAEAMRIIY